MVAKIPFRRPASMAWCSCCWAPILVFLTTSIGPAPTFHCVAFNFHDVALSSSRYRASATRPSFGSRHKRLFERDSKFEVDSKCDVAVHDSGEGPPKENKGIWFFQAADTAKVYGSIGLWYWLNVQFNIHNKKALTLLPLPFTIGALQTVVGVPFFLLPWISGLRPFPILHEKGFKPWYRFWKLGIWHAVLHLSAMRALSAGAVSFVSVVKAAEPVVSAVCSLFLKQKPLSVPTYLSLVPIIAGVAVASCQELSFTWSAFWWSSLSNLSSALRGIYGKDALSDRSKIGKNLTPRNVFAMIALSATVFEILPALFEAHHWSRLISHEKGQALYNHILLSGVFYYLYNELALVVLSGFSPLSHAVANSLKRVTNIISSAVVFRTKFTPIGIAGSTAAIFGAFLYSLCRSRFG